MGRQRCGTRRDWGGTGARLGRERGAGLGWWSGAGLGRKCGGSGVGLDGGREGAGQEWGGTGAEVSSVGLHGPQRVVRRGWHGQRCDLTLL